MRSSLLLWRIPQGNAFKSSGNETRGPSKRHSPFLKKHSPSSAVQESGEWHPKDRQRAIPQGDESRETGNVSIQRFRSHLPWGTPVDRGRMRHSLLLHDPASGEYDESSGNGISRPPQKPPTPQIQAFPLASLSRTSLHQVRPTPPIPSETASRAFPATASLNGVATNRDEGRSVRLDGESLAGDLR